MKSKLGLVLIAAFWIISIGACASYEVPERTPNSNQNDSGNQPTSQEARQEARLEALREKYRLEAIETGQYTFIVYLRCQTEFCADSFLAKPRLAEGLCASKQMMLREEVSFANPSLANGSSAAVKLVCGAPAESELELVSEIATKTAAQVDKVLDRLALER